MRSCCPENKRERDRMMISRYGDHTDINSQANTTRYDQKELSSRHNVCGRRSRDIDTSISIWIIQTLGWGWSPGQTWQFKERLENLLYITTGGGRCLCKKRFNNDLKTHWVGMNLWKFFNMCPILLWIWLTPPDSLFINLCHCFGGDGWPYIRHFSVTILQIFNFSF